MNEITFNLGDRDGGNEEKLVNIDNVYLNISQKVIITTEDKLKLKLNTHLKKIETKKAWITPLAVFITLIIALVTSTFEDFILGKATWEAIFIISSIITFIWFCFSAYNSFQAIAPEDLVEDIKKSSRDLIESDKTVEVESSKS